ncbi:hypothetical protein BCR44DRAFT_59790 [Catenaria anguillulae PL171]|uniref:Uncharacterized protein n=1 Tax=Catenaria anguillulae PL171 TaxID=765915 RepID=A0A1Y2HPR9_9FUNG|nr:hypothetical protein BCR44DRAFT_59790 [Catenaria anguillulae PL171]
MSSRDAHVTPAGSAAPTGPTSEVNDLYVRDPTYSEQPDPRDLDDRDDIVRSGAKVGEAAAATPTGWRALVRTRRRKVIACCLLLVVLLVILIPIAYFAIVPMIIRKKFSGSQLYLYPDQVDVNMFASKDPALNIKMDSELFVYGTDMETVFAPEYWKITTGDGTLIAELPMPEKITHTDKRYKMKMDSDLKIVDPAKIGELLAQLSSPQGISDALGEIKINTVINAKIFGIKMPATSAVKTYDLRKLSFEKVFNKMLKNETLPGYLGEVMPADPTLKTFPRPAARATDPLKLNGVSMTTNDKGFSVTADVDYDNATPFATSFGGMSLVVRLYETPVLRIGVRDVNLVRGKGNMKPSLDVELLEDFPKIGELLRNAVFDFVGKNTFPVGISGPINLLARESRKPDAKMVPAEWMSTMTKPLAVNIPPALMAKLIAGDDKAKSGNSTASSSLLSSLDIKASVAMDAEKITIPVRVDLPKSLSLPELKLDYGIGIGLYAEAAKFLGVSVSNIAVTKPQGSDRNRAQATITITPDSSQGSMAAVAKLVDGILYGETVSQVVIKDIAITPANGAAECKWCSSLFTKLDFPLPIQPIPFKATLKNLMSKPASSEPAGPGLKINSVSVTQEPNSPAITVAASVDLPAPIKMIDQVDLPFAKLDFQVDDSTFVSVSLPNGLKVSGNSTTINVAVRATFANGGDVQDKVAALVGRFLGTQDGASKLAVTGVQFGVADKPFRTFEQVNVHLTTDDVKELLAARPASGNGGMALPPGLIKPTGVDIAMTGANTIMVSLSAAVNNPFPVSISIGSLSLSALLNDQTLATITLPPLAVQASQSNDLVLKDIRIELGTSGALPPMIGELVGKVLAKQPLSGTVGVTGITLGAPNGGQQSATISTFARVRITKDLAALTSGGSSSGSSVLDTSALLPAGGLSIPTPKLVSAGIATKEGAALAVSAALDYTHPLPVSVKIPYISLSLGLDNAGEVAAITVEGLDIQRNSGRLSLNVGLKMSNEEAVQNRIAQVVGQALSGQDVTGSLIISRVVLGASPTATTGLFSAINVPVSLGTLVNGAGRLGPGNNPDAPSPLAGLLDGFGKPEINNIRVATQDNGRVSIGLSAAFRNPLPVSIDIGYLALQARVSGAPLVGISVNGLKVAAAGDNKLELNVNLDFSSAPETQAAVKLLVGEILYKSNDWKSTVGVGGIVLGVNERDTIRTLSRVSVDLPVTKFISPSQVPELFKKLTGGSGSGGSGTSPLALLRDVSVQALPKDHIKVRAGLALPLPVSLDIGFVELTARLNRIAAVTVRVNGIKTTGDKNELVSLDVDIFVQDSEALAGTIRDLVRDMLARKPELPYLVGATGLRFGKDAAKPIETFAAVEADLPLAMLGINGSILDKIGGGGGSGLVKFNGVRDIKVATRPNKRVQADLVASIQFPFKLNVSIPAITARVQVDDEPIVSIFTGLSIGSASSDLALSVGLQFEDNDKTRAMVAQLVQQVLGGKVGDINHSLVVTGVALGAKEDDLISAFALVKVAVPLKDLLNKGLPTLPPSGGNSTSPVSLSDISVEAKPGSVVEVGVNATLGFNFPVTVDIGYVAATIGINRKDMVVLSVGPIQASPTTKSLGLKLSAKFLSSEALTADLQAVVTAFLRRMNGENIELPGAVSVGGLVFGVSAEDNIGLLSRTFIDIPIAKLAGSLPAGGSPAAPDAPKLIGGISNITVATLPGDIIRASLVAKVNLPMKLSVNVPFIGLGAALDNVVLARIAIENLRITPGNNDVALTVTVQVQDNEEAQKKIAQVIGQALYGPEPPQSFALVTGLAFGVSPADSVQTFAGVRAGMKVTDIVDKIKAGLGNNNGGAAPAAPSLIAGVSNITVDVKPDAVVDLSLNLQLAQSLPLSLDVGFLTATVGINKNALVTATVGGIKATPATRELGLRASFKLYSTPELQTDLRDIVLAILRKTEVTGNVFVAGLAFGASPQDHIALLSQTKVGLPIKTLMGMLPKQDGGDSKLPMPKLRGIKDIKVATLPGDVVEASLSLGLDLPFKVSVNVPFVGAVIAIDRVPLVRIGVQGLRITPENADLKLGIRAQIVDSPEGQALVARLIPAILFSPDPVQNILMITGLTLGVAPDNAITTFQQVVVPVPLQDLVKDIPKGLPTIGGGNSSLPIAARNIRVDVLPGAIVDASATVVLTNLTFPADISVPYFQVALGLNKNKLVTAAMSGFKISPTTKELGLSLRLQFENNPEVARDLAQVFDQIMNKKEVTGALLVTGLAFGHSLEDKVELLSTTNLALPLTMFSRQLGTIPDMIGQILAGVGKGPSPVQVKALGVAFKEGDVIDVSTTVGLGIQFPLSVSVPFINVDAQLGPLKALSIQVSGVKATPETKELSVSIRVIVADTPQLAQVIAKVAGDIANGNLNQAVTVTGFAIGVSAEDKISPFSEIKLPINLAPFLGAPPALPASASNATSLLQQINPRLSELKITTLPQRVIAISAKASFTNQMPVTVDVGYVSVGVGVDSERIADIRMRGFNMKPGDNGISLDLSIQLANGDANKVGAAIMDILQGKLDGHRVSVMGAVVGPNEQDNIQALSLARIELPVSRLTTPEDIKRIRDSLPGLIGGGAGGNSTSPVALTNLAVNMQQPGPIIISAAADLKTPADVQVNLGFFQAAFALGPNPAEMPNPPLVGFQIRGLKVEQNKLAVTIVLNVFDTENNQNLVAGLIRSILAGADLPDFHAFVAGFVIGASDSDKSEILSRTALSLPIRSIIKGPIKLPGGGGAGEMPAINPRDISIILENKYTLRIGAKIDVKNPTPVSVALGYISANVQINGLTFGSFAIDRPLAIGKGDNTLDLSVAINLNQDPKLEDAVAQLVNALLNGQLKGVEAGVNGLTFGANKDAANKILSRAEIKQTISLGNTPAPSVPSVKIERVKAAITPAGIEATVPIELPFTFTLGGIDTFSVIARARNNPMVMVGVSGLKADKSNRLTLGIRADMVTQVLAPTAAALYEAIKAGQPVSGLSVTDFKLKLANGEEFTLLSKIAATLPERKFEDLQFQVKIANLLKKTMDTKTLLHLPIPMEIGAGHVDFDVHTDRGKIGEVRRRNLVVKSEEGGFVVRIVPTIPWYDLVELGKVLANMEKENKYLRDFNIRTVDNTPVPWATTMANTIKLRLIPKWGSFDSPDLD